MYNRLAALLLVLTWWSLPVRMGRFQGLAYGWLGCGFRLLREVLALGEVRWPGGVVLGGSPWGTLRLHRSEACMTKEELELKHCFVTLDEEAASLLHYVIV